MPSRIRSILLNQALNIRGDVVVPLTDVWRRGAIALSSGTDRLKRMADAAWVHGDGPAAMAIWQQLEREEPGRAAWPLKVAQVLRERGDMENAERVLLEARARGIRSEEIDLRLQRYARLRGVSNTGIDDAEAIVADPVASGASVFYAAFYLMAENRLEAARAGFARVADDRQYGHLARGHLAAIGSLERRRAAGQPDIPGYLSSKQNSIFVREPSSDTLVVGFALAEGALGPSMNALHAMLSPAGVNALYLFDSRNLFHLGGSDRFGPGYEALLDGVRELKARVGARRLIMLGGSGTGYTAMRTAIDLDADGALVASPATMLRPWSKPSIARGAHTLFRLKKEILPMMKDLRPLLMNRTTCARIEVYYSPFLRRDLMQVGNISGVPGLVLHPVEGHRQHDCLTEMAARGYGDLLKDFAAR